MRKLMDWNSLSGWSAIAVGSILCCGCDATGGAHAKLVSHDAGRLTTVESNNDAGVVSTADGAAGSQDGRSEDSGISDIDDDAGASESAEDSGVPVSTYRPDAGWDCEEPIEIEDGTLERAIRMTVGNMDGPLGQRDVNALTSLSTRLQVPIDEDFDWLPPIDSLGGVQCFVHLESAGFSFGTKKPDLAPIAYLKDLRHLTVEMGYNGDDPVDYEPLTVLTRLRGLGLPWQMIDDVGFTKFLGKLEIVVFDNNNIEDITPLINLRFLTELRVKSNLITDLSPISGLSRLKKVHAMNNQIRTLQPFIAANHFAGEDHMLGVTENPLDCEAEKENIRILRKRGIRLYTDCDPPPCPACPDVED